MSDWVIFALGVVAGAVAVFALPAAFFAAVGLFSRSRREGTCYLCAHHPKWKIGEVSQIRYLWGMWVHDLFWSYRRWHRAAWREHRWNPKNQHRTGDAKYRIHCAVCEDPADDGAVGYEIYRLSEQSGPYFDADAARPVASDHEKTYHGGRKTTRIEVQSR